jgi:hypothetical protein
MIKKINKHIYWESESGWSLMVEKKINEIVNYLNKLESGMQKQLDKDSEDKGT